MKGEAFPATLGRSNSRVRNLEMMHCAVARWAVVSGLARSPPLCALTSLAQDGSLRQIYLPLLPAYFLAEQVCAQAGPGHVSHGPPAEGSQYCARAVQQGLRVWASGLNRQGGLEDYRGHTPRMAASRPGECTRRGAVLQGLIRTPPGRLIGTCRCSLLCFMHVLSQTTYSLGWGSCRADLQRRLTLGLTAVPQGL
jgi:hypothetical protein